MWLPESVPTACRDLNRADNEAHTFELPSTESFVAGDQNHVKKVCGKLSEFGNQAGHPDYAKGLVNAISKDDMASVDVTEATRCTQSILDHFPPDKVFPAVDLLRILIGQNKAAAEAIADASHLVSSLVQTCPKHAPAAMMLFRALCNILHLCPSKLCISLDEVAQLVTTAVSGVSTGLLIAHACLLLDTYTLAVYVCVLPQCTHIFSQCLLPHALAHVQTRHSQNQRRLS